MADVINFSDFLSTDPSMAPLAELLETIMGLADDTVNEQTVESMKGMLSGAITPTLHKQMVTNILTNYRDNGYTRGQAQAELDSLRASIDNLIEEMNPSSYKREMITHLFSIIIETIDEANNIYLSHDIELPITLDEKAIVPTYAHDTDAAADLYARETITIPAHSFSNKVDTGVHIGLPEGWLAHIAPRSSIGAKTPLRLSNNLAVIDSHYRGSLIVMFDNLSDSDYIINAGDRIAQLWVCPSYRFKANVVDSLDETDRGEGGLGSTGK